MNRGFHNEIYGKVRRRMSTPTKRLSLRKGRPVL